MTCGSLITYVFLKKYGPSTEEGDAISFVLCVCPSSNKFAVTGPKGQGLPSFLMRKE